MIWFSALENLLHFVMPGKWMSYFLFISPCRLPFCSPPTLRNGFWVSVSMTTSPPLSTTMRSPRTPVPLVTLTPQQAGLWARCYSGGVYAWMCHSCLSVLFFFFFLTMWPWLRENLHSFIHFSVMVVDTITIHGAETQLKWIIASSTYRG